MSVGGAYWICAWMGIADRRTGGRTGAQWQGLHGMQSEWAGILELRPQKSHRRTGMYTGAAICGFTAMRTEAHMEGSPAQGAGPSSGSLEIRVRCSRRKHSSETSRENISEMG